MRREPEPDVCSNILLSRRETSPLGYSLASFRNRRRDAWQGRVVTTTMSAKNKQKKKLKRKKRNALVICTDRKQFWTTQTQFWQWVRDRIIVKTQDNPLTGSFLREHEELMVLIGNTVLNLAAPNHLREALSSRRLVKSKKN